jgi:hypothetical protein
MAQLAAVHQNEKMSQMFRLNSAYKREETKYHFSLRTLFHISTLLVIKPQPVLPFARSSVDPADLVPFSSLS